MHDPTRHVPGIDDPHDLRRFVVAQKGVHAQAMEEIRGGRKASHWMWFVFPQLQGLGQSAMSRHFGIAGVQEANAYLAHPLLGARLREGALAVLDARAPVKDIFGPVDAVKLRSCVTLFEAVAPAEPELRRLLAEKLDGRRDPQTLALISAAGRVC
ncbi:MAG: DUF1810 domain-containing protein [Pseudomonadota bacterium]|nr:DUF1810 domain-containing protein [Pseudomonadota bacterium]